MCIENIYEERKNDKARVSEIENAQTSSKEITTHTHSSLSDLRTTTAVAADIAGCYSADSTENGNIYFYSARFLSLFVHFFFLFSFCRFIFSFFASSSYIDMPGSTMHEAYDANGRKE